MNGDATSQLVQTVAREIGLKLTASGKGDEDIRGLVRRTYNAELACQEIWKGVAELFQMKELGQLSESLQAKVAAIILRSKANVELGAK
jgi:hypothetical protein